MISVALIGSTGLVGREIELVLSNTKDVELICISREDVRTKSKSGNYDVIINANGSGNKTWCNENVLDSLEINCNSIYKYHENYRASRYILISSIDAGSPVNYSESYSVNPYQLHTYGMHKQFAESIVRQLNKDYLILRLGGLVSKYLAKNCAYDIKHMRQLFLDRNSVINFISTTDIAFIVKKLLLNCQYDTLNIAANQSASINSLIDIANLRDYYSSLNQDRKLPKVNYLIPTERLQTIFRAKSTLDYFSEYYHEN